MLVRNAGSRITVILSSSETPERPLYAEGKNNDPDFLGDSKQPLNICSPWPLQRPRAGFVIDEEVGHGR